MMYKSQFQKLVPYDWFCGPGSHIYVDFYKKYVVIVTTNNNFARYCFIKGRYIFAIVDKF